MYIQFDKDTAGRMAGDVECPSDINLASQWISHKHAHRISEKEFIDAGGKIESEETPSTGGQGGEGEGNKDPADPDFDPESFDPDAPPDDES